MPPVGRRDFIKGAAAFGAILLARPKISWGEAPAFGVARASRLFPGGGFLVHSDLHNHTVLSDGAGSPQNAFELMRASGLDVAAITDHSIMGGDVAALCQHRQPCTYATGIDEDAWRQTGMLADDANDDGAFVAMRGFEWSTGSIGHANVWFTNDWTDPLATGALVDPKGI